MVELRRFFEDYKKLEHKHVSVEEFLGKEAAYKIIRNSINLYSENEALLQKM